MFASCFFMLACLVVVSGAIWRLCAIDTITAKTTIRLWHELHVAKRIPHDFADMLAPTAGGSHKAIHAYGEIRAIAKCTHDKDGNVVLSGIAHHPDQEYATAELVRTLVRDKVGMDWSKLKSQPRWYCEGMYESTRENRP